MINSKKIAIIIPTFNEEKNINRLIISIRKFLLKSFIYVIDDSKNLKTKKILKGKKNNYCGGKGRLTIQKKLAHFGLD